MTGINLLTPSRKCLAVGSDAAPEDFSASRQIWQPIDSSANDLGTREVPTGIAHCVATRTNLQRVDTLPIAVSRVQLHCAPPAHRLGQRRFAIGPEPFDRSRESTDRRRYAPRHDFGRCERGLVVAGHAGPPFSNRVPDSTVRRQTISRLLSPGESRHRLRAMALVSHTGELGPYG